MYILYQVISSWISSAWDDMSQVPKWNMGKIYLNSSHRINPYYHIVPLGWHKNYTLCHLGTCYFSIKKSYSFCRKGTWVLRKEISMQIYITLYISKNCLRAQKIWVSGEKNECEKLWLWHIKIILFVVQK